MKTILWMSSVVLLLGLAGGSATAVTDSFSADAEARAGFLISSQPVREGALEGVIAIYSRPDGAVAAMTFESAVTGEVVGFPAATIDTVNKIASGVGADATPMDDGFTVTWIRNLPGGGSVYGVSFGGTPIGLIVVQPDGTVVVYPL